MEPIEQVFLRVSSVDGFRMAEITAATEAVRVSDMTEIVGWFTDSEEQSILRYDTLNVFFHPLPGGDYALGLIYPDQRGFFAFLQPPKSFYVRVLVVPPRTLLKKGNNPPALYEELSRLRKVPLVSRPPKRLSPIQPLKTPLLFDRELLASLADSPGAEAMTALMRSLFDSEMFFLFSSNRPVISILAGLFALLPVSFRTELTFSTNLFFSVQNPFRIVGLGPPRHRAAEQAKMLGIPMVDMENGGKRSFPFVKHRSDAAWLRFVADVLRHRRFEFLEGQWKSLYRQMLATYEEGQPPLVEWESLDELADSWLNSSSRSDESEKIPKAAGARCLDTVEKLLPILNEEQRQSGPSRAAGDGPKHDAPASGRLASLRRERSELDVLLDRLVSGEEVLPEIRGTWMRLGDRTTREEREMICEEYLAKIRSILLSVPDGDRPRQAERSAALLQVMSIFLEKPESA